MSKIIYVVKTTRRYSSREDRRIKLEKKQDYINSLFYPKHSPKNDTYKIQVFIGRILT